MDKENLIGEQDIYYDNTSEDSVSQVDDGDIKDLTIELEKSTWEENRGLLLTWNHVTVHVTSSYRTGWRQEEVFEIKEILKDVSGSAEPGHLLAIMGPSGAGKTTLMNVLTGRSLERLVLQGEVRVNGRNMGRAITRVSAYVQQDDLFIGTLTVREHLIFQAMLRLDRRLTYKERMNRVAKVIHELGLLKCADTLIGVPGRVKGISGGEMKRLAFASEVLTEPRVLFCDEPTSGLDSFMAQSVVSVLKGLAAGGRTIICTIHQPSSDTYALFDHLLLLAEGRVAYQGSSKAAIEHFSSLGIRCPINFNPADFFIETLSIIPGQEDTCRHRIKMICEEFIKSRESTPSSGSIDTIWLEQTFGKYNGTSLDIKTANPGYGKYTSSWFRQLRVLLWRSSLMVRRERMLTIVRLFQTLAVAAVIGLIYSGQKMNQEGIMNINGALFLIAINLSFQNAMTVVTTFCEEMPVFLREHWNGMYRTDTYFLSKTIAEIPLFTFLSCIFVSVTYFWIGLYPEPYHFAITLVVAMLTSNTACSYGYMISGLSKSAQIAASIATPLMIPLLLFGGFFINNSSVPEWLIWVKYLSWFYYSNEALCINQWKDVDSITCNNNTVSCIKNGTLVLESLNFHHENLYPNLGYLASLLIGFRLIAYMGVYLKARKKK